MLALPNKEVLLCKAEFFWQKLEKVFLVPHGSWQNDDPISPISTQQLAHTVASVALTGTVSSSECKQRCAVVCVRVINGQHTMYCFISCIWAPPPRLYNIILYCNPKYCHYFLCVSKGCIRGRQTNENYFVVVYGQ